MGSFLSFLSFLSFFEEYAAHISSSRLDPAQSLFNIIAENRCTVFFLNS